MRTQVSQFLNSEYMYMVTHRAGASVSSPSSHPPQPLPISSPSDDALNARASPPTSTLLLRAALTLALSSSLSTGGGGESSVRACELDCAVPFGLVLDEAAEDVKVARAWLSDCA